MSTIYEKDRSYEGTSYSVEGHRLYRHFILTVDAAADDPATSFAAATVDANDSRSVAGFGLYTSHHKVSGYYAVDFIPDPTDDPLTYYMAVVYAPATGLANIDWDVEWGWAYETTKKFVTDDGVTIGPHSYVTLERILDIRERYRTNPDSLSLEEGILFNATFGQTAYYWTEVNGVRIDLFQMDGDRGRRVVGLDVPKELYSMIFRLRTGLLGSSGPRDILRYAYKVNQYSFMDNPPRTVMCQPPRVNRSIDAPIGQPTQGFLWTIEIPFLVDVNGWRDSIYDLWVDDNGDETFIYGPTHDGDNERIVSHYDRGVEADFDAMLRSIIMPPSNKPINIDGKGGGR